MSGADRLCIDGAGNTFATTPAGVQVFNAKGEHLGNIEAPYDMPPQNCGFAAPEKRLCTSPGAASSGAFVRSTPG